MDLTDKAIYQLGKILGLHFYPCDYPSLKASAQLHDQAENLQELIEYLELEGWSNFNKCLFHTQDAIYNSYRNNPAYKSVSLDKVGAEKHEINQKVSWVRQKSYATSENFNRYFLSFDIKSANFTVLKELCGIDVNTDLTTFLAPFLPSGHCQPPNCLLNSKWFRLLVFGKLNKLQKIWELKILRQYQHLWTIITGQEEGPNSQPEIVHVNSDEVVISIDTPSEGEEIIKSMALGPEFKAKVFKLEPADMTGVEQSEEFKNTKNYCVRHYQDGTWHLMNIHPPHYNTIWINTKMRYE